MFKKFLFVALAILALQGTVQSEERDTSRGLVEQIEKALENLKKIIENAVNSALEQFENVFNKLLDTAKGIILEATGVLNKMAEDALELIRSIVGDASNNGIDATKCLLGNEEKIISIPDEFLRQITECVDENIKTARTIIDEAIDIVKAKLNILSQLEKKAKECGIGIGALPCLGKVLAEIGIQILQLPVQIAEHVANILNIVGNIAKSVTECSVNSIAGAGVQIASIISEVKECVEKAVEENKPAEPKYMMH
ncbi:PREDICTED: uncharacterized protein LOC108562985 [Nicrophorus vespilloides]|uniref:Uncharacterized protein LOC108562985 n=1 Tax=Nicrophorus vespilloides TaxID=110193 RepID=A0ABM1MQZ2_NICVS|nr:PREDICTED: uncharacterized protein LOC108562985 [Nicrophorus vespilloides]